MALEHRMIEPFSDKQVREGVISYGVSSYGYDVRIADEFKIFTNINSTIVDPKNFDPRSFVDFKGDVCIIPPNSFALARTVEYFRIPRNVITVCVGKSHLRALRDHRERHALRAGVGGHRHPRGLEHDAPARQDLRQRGHRPGAVLRERRGVRDLLRRQEGQVPGAAGRSPCRSSRRAADGPRDRHHGRPPHRLRHPAPGVRPRSSRRAASSRSWSSGRQDQRRRRRSSAWRCTRRGRRRSSTASSRASRYLGAAAEVADAALRARRGATASCPTSSTPPPTSTPSCASTGKWVPVARPEDGLRARAARRRARLREAGAGAEGRAGRAARPRHPRAAAGAQPRLLGLRLHVERRLGGDQQGHRHRGHRARDAASRARRGRRSWWWPGPAIVHSGGDVAAGPPGAGRLGGRAAHRQRVRRPRPREGDPEDQPRRLPDERPRRRGRQPQPPLGDQRRQPRGRRSGRRWRRAS